MDDMQKALFLKSVERSFEENDKVRGSLAELSDDRLVFIGEHPDNKDEWYIGFRNSEGEDTRLRLSKEAMSMLMQLYKKHPKGNDPFPLRIKTMWQVTVLEKSDGATVGSSDV